MTTAAPLPPPTADSISAIARESGWMRSSWWDTCLIAFGWLPFYAWLATTPLGRGSADPGGSLATALALAFSVNFAHRHAVLMIVYGDPANFRQRASAYKIAPVVAFAVVALSVALPAPVYEEAMLGALGAWNVWHVVKQRYGLLRIYAGRAKGGLETRRAARADSWLLWSAVAVTAGALLALRTSTFDTHPQARQTLSIIEAWVNVATIRWLALAALANFAVAAARWLVVQRGAEPAWQAPRRVLLASTFALLAIFIVHGPVVGYLVFGVAHSLEYLAFVYHFGERKYAGRRDSLAALLFGRMKRAPILIAPLLVAYVFLHQHRFSLAFITYFSTTSALHYLYDGWIWRVRDPAVAKPLAISSGRPT